MESAPKTVLLYGPVVAKLEGAYGGGTGGYTRKMGLYLNYFRSEAFKMVPVFHTVKGQYRYGFFVVRFFIDLWVFLRGLIQLRPDVVHILAQYRTAVPREYALLILAGLFRVPVVYEIKAGVFVSWYQSTNPVFRYMSHFCLKRSKVILCQGMPYVEFLREKLGIEGHYYPNFVADEEIPAQIGPKLQEAVARVCFVGYAFRDKGVFELVEGCLKASKVVPIHLTLIGKEHEEFTQWMNGLDLGDRFTVDRKGRLPHEQVLKEYQKNDIYCYPTRHKGEGHNNSINEAMMMGLVIITTRQGFLGSILSPERAYFLDEVATPQVQGVLEHIGTHREEAQEKSRKVRQYLLQHFTSSVAYAKLENHYRQAIGLPEKVYEKI